MPSRENHCVSRPRVGDPMPQPRFAEDGALIEKTPQPAFVKRAEPRQIVKAHLVNREYQDQPEPGILFLSFEWQKNRSSQNQKGQQPACGSPAHDLLLLGNE